MRKLIVLALLVTTLAGVVSTATAKRSTQGTVEVPKTVTYSEDYGNGGG